MTRRGTRQARSHKKKITGFLALQVEGDGREPRRPSVKSNKREKEKGKKEKGTNRKPPDRGDAFRMSRDQEWLCCVWVSSPSTDEAVQSSIPDRQTCTKRVSLFSPKSCRRHLKNKTPGHDLPPLRDNHQPPPPRCEKKR